MAVKAVHGAPVVDMEDAVDDDPWDDGILRTRAVPVYGAPRGWYTSYASFVSVPNDSDLQLLDDLSVPPW